MELNSAGVFPQVTQNYCKTETMWVIVSACHYNYYYFLRSSQCNIPLFYHTERHELFSSIFHSSYMMIEREKENKLKINVAKERACD